MLPLEFISQKGGAGKTTLACATAVAAERAGLATVLIDLDPQASASKWSDLRTLETPVVTSKESRDGERFRCTTCGFEIHADKNAGLNIRTRGHNVIAGYGKTRPRAAGNTAPDGANASNRQGPQCGTT